MNASPSPTNQEEPPHTPLNLRNATGIHLSSPPETPSINRYRRRPRIGNGKIVKEKIMGKSIVSLNQLVRFMIFDERKKALTIIRKDSVYHTLKESKHKISKSKNLNHMLGVLSGMYDYETHKVRVLRGIQSFQGIVRKYIKNRINHINGPGVPVSRCVNDDCPYSLESLEDIPKHKRMTWREPYDGFPAKIYGCDAEMMISSLRRSLKRHHHNVLNNTRTYPGERISGIQNPFTREGLTVDVIRRCNEYARFNKISLLYNTPTSRPRPRDITPRDLQRPRQFRRGIGNRRLRRQIIDDTDSDNELPPQNQRGSFARSPLEHINVTSPHMAGRTISETIQRLTALIPTAEATSEAFRDLEFYTPETLLVAPLTDMIRILDNVPLEITENTITDTLRFLNFHIDPVVHALGIGTDYGSVKDVIQRLTRRIPVNVPATLRTKIRRALRIFVSGTLQHMIRSCRNAAIGTRGRPHLYENHILSVADMVYRAVGGILLLTHPVLCQYAEHIAEEDRKSFSIVFMGALVEGRYLGEEFAWARFIE